MHPGSQTICNEIVNHAKQNKEFSHLEKTAVTKAVMEIFDGQCPKTRISLGRIRAYAYKNLKRKLVITQEPQIKKNYKDEWEELKTNASNVATFENLNWTVIQDNENSLSFIHIGSIRYDGVRVLKEVQFLKDDKEEKITFSAKYHQRNVQFSKLVDIDSHFASCRIIHKARNLIELLAKSNICHGFNGVGYDFKETPGNMVYEKHTVTDKDVVEDRIFSKNCDVLLTWVGKNCYRCLVAKASLNKTTSRHSARETVSMHTNNRYLSREELIEKIEKISNAHRLLVKQLKYHESSDSKDQSNASEDQSSDSD